MDRSRARKGDGSLSLSDRKRMQVRMIDMHAHLSCLEKGGEEKEPSILKTEGEREAAWREDRGIITCFSAGEPWQWQVLQNLRGRRGVLASFGIHPWYAHRHQVEDCMTYLRDCDMIGEIGMDSVWCQVPLDVQERVFERQLQAAQELGKPVVLHTKGQERRIGQMLRGFHGKVCVHWYSGSWEDLEPFLEQDCYFTLGPDTAALCRGQYGRDRLKEAAVRERLVRELSPRRMFVETDGAEAVEWAWEGRSKAAGRSWESRSGAAGQAWEDGPEGRMGLICRALRETMEYAALEKGISLSEMEERMKGNLREFLGPERDGRM